MAVGEGEEVSAEWWLNRWAWADVRAGGLPPECDLDRVSLRPETDPATGDEYVRFMLSLPPETPLWRVQTLCHLLSSVLAGEGYTLRLGRKLILDIPGIPDGLPLTAAVGSPTYTEARVCGEGCSRCVAADLGGVACCSEGSAFSLADIGSILLAGNEALAADVLGRPGQSDGYKWEPHMKEARCVYHSRETGCTLPAAQMPLQCRTYLCQPARLMTPEQLVAYEGYVERLEEQERFVSGHMREQGGVDFDSPLPAIRAAAEKAFAAWVAETGVN
jgi:hypothetical protein